MISVAGADGMPAMKLSNCQGVKISNCTQTEKLPLYVSEDEKCFDIFLINNVFPGIAELCRKKGRNIISRIILQ